MILGASTSEKLRLVTSASGTPAISWKVDYITVSAATPPVVQNVDSDYNAAQIASSTTTDIKVGDASNKTRILSAWFRNESSSVSCDVTPVQTDGSNPTLGPKASLLPAETLFYTGSSWIHYDANGAPYSQSVKLDAKLRVVSDVTNASTSFADVTGLTAPLISGRKYAFEAYLYHQTNATTTGARFGVNIGATPTLLCLHGAMQFTSGTVAATTLIQGAMITAVDTAIAAETTGPGAVNMEARLNGFIQPSADGAFAIRCQSEVAVAGGLVVKAGSWLRIWECDN